MLALSQATGLLGAATWALRAGGARPALADLWPAAGAGAAAAIGLCALYRGMAIGAMGIVAPISAASPIVPLAVDVGARADRPERPAVARHRRRARRRRAARPRAAGRRDASGLATGVALALVAALGFGLFIVGLDAASDDSVAWTILVVRATSTLVALVAAVVVSAPLRRPRGCSR